MNTKLISLCYQSTRTTLRVSLHTRAQTQAPVYAYTRKRLYARARVALSLVAASLALTLLLPVAASASTQGYSTQDKTITKGMAVAVLSTQAGTTNVEKSSVDHASKTLGVVVDPAADAVSVSTDSGQVYVASTGTANVYVTDLNGTVHKGDLLAPSPLAGVLMRAVDGSHGILGVAMGDFPEKTAQSVSLKDENGGDAKTKVALLTINMDVKFTINTPNAGKSLLQRVGEAIVHHEVTSVQALVALTILILLLVVEGGIIYGAISSSIVSLGRNPLAKNVIMRGLGQITGLVFIILALGMGAVYLVLWV